MLSGKTSMASNRSLDTLIDPRRYNPYNLHSQHPNTPTSLPPLGSIGPEIEKNEHLISSTKVAEIIDFNKTVNHEWFDVPTEKTFDRFSIRWDLWLYFVFYVIILLFGLLFIMNIKEGNFFGKLKFPGWIPGFWVLVLIWIIVFIGALFSLWVLSSHIHANFYVLLVLMNFVLLMLFIVVLWFTGVIILGTVIIAIAIIYAIFVCVAMSRDSMTAMTLQIPYILFIILLFVISLQISHDN